MNKHYWHNNSRATNINISDVEKTLKTLTNRKPKGKDDIKNGVIKIWKVKRINKTITEDNKT